MSESDYALKGLETQNFGKELADVDFASIIGGPMNAIVEAQMVAAQKTIDYVKKVGFMPNEDGSSTGKPRYIEFDYEKPGGPFGLIPQRFSLKVPFLTMIPIPSIRIDRVTIELNVKLSSSQSATFDDSESNTEITSTQKTEETTKEKRSMWSGKSTKGDPTTKTTNMVGTVENQLTAKNGAEVKREYSLYVFCEFVQDKIPPGMEKILDIMERQVTESLDDSMSQGFESKLSSKLGGGAAAPAPAAE